jgi:hypothetical protein
MSYEIGTLEPCRQFQRTPCAIFYAVFAWDHYTYVPQFPFWGA